MILHHVIFKKEFTGYYISIKPININTKDDIIFEYFSIKLLLIAFFPILFPSTKNKKLNINVKIKVNIILIPATLAATPAAILFIERISIKLTVSFNPIN